MQFFGAGGIIVVQVPDVRNMYLIFAKQNKRKFGMATRYGLDCPGIESPCWRHFSCRFIPAPEAYPASCTMDTGSVPGVKRLECGANHPPSPSPKLMNRLELHRRHPFVPA